MTAVRRSAESGFTLIELLVSVVLVAIVMAGLFPVTFKVAMQSRQSNVITQRDAASAAEVARLTTATFSALTNGTTCTTFSVASFPHTKCVTIASINTNRKQITVIVTPLNGAGVTPDTTVVERSQGKSGNPLNTP